MKTLLLLDGNSLLNRAHYGLGVYHRLTAADGTPTAAIYAFFNSLIAWLEEFRPDALFVAWDVGKKTKRHELYPEYKGGRTPMDDDLRVQFPICQNLLTALGVANFGLEGYEADDLIGTAARLAEAQGLEVIIISGDRDLYQLISEKISIIRPTTRAGKPVQLQIDLHAFCEHYGFDPDQFTDFRALQGDSSDGLPGVRGIGEKSALKLIQSYGSLDTIYSHLEELSPSWRKKLEADRDMAYLTRQLSLLDCHVPAQLEPRDLAYDISAPADAMHEMEKLGLKTTVKKWRDLIPGVPLSKTSTAPNVTAELEIRELSSLDELLSQLSEPESAIALSYELQGEEPSQLSFYTHDGWRLTLSPSEFKPEDLKKIARQDLTIIVHDCKSLLRGLGFSLPEIRYFDLHVAAYLLGSGREEKRSLDELLSDYELFSEQAGEGSRVAGIFSLYHLFVENLAEAGMDSLAYELEFPLAEILARMELAGITVSQAELEAFASDFSTEIDALEEKIYELAGQRFNIGSPSQLATVLYEELGLPPGKMTKSGYGSTGNEELLRLYERHEIIPLIVAYRELTKLNQGFVKSLGAKIAGDGRIHTHFNQTLTGTGRLSSADPNLQNIPVRSERGREIRRVFKAQAGYVLLSADYSQIELRLLAEFSRDENLLEAFQSGLDIHRVTAEKLFPAMSSLGARERAIAKTVNFSIVYGISAFSLAKDLQVSQKVAQQYIDSYHTSYPKVQPWLEEQIDLARRTGAVTTMMGRKRAIPELKSPQYVRRQYGERQAMNAPVQGSAADLIKLAMVHLDRALREQDLPARLLLQIHDELILEVQEEALPVVAKVLSAEMRGAMALTIPLESSLEAGPNWGELSPIDI